MATFLFDSIVFGPVKSRRLGTSLGINLLPTSGKICSFNCIYCECGLNEERKPDRKRLPAAREIDAELRLKLETLMHENNEPDVITFAGNGEPTLHPDFLKIIKNTISARNAYCPGAKVSVLSNSTRIWNKDVIDALNLVDMNILKLDSAVEETVKLINDPNGSFNITDCIEQLKVFKGKLIIQTLFCRGEVNGKHFDNTTESELTEWIVALRAINPEYVMIYSISRDTPINSIKKVSKDELLEIGKRLAENNIAFEIA
ncbi:radical SAM protein [Saccharicrinis sp. FJH54]|uniref:radical SAM protein n=1 Tax=Saccharicrinis sp. FJH54 TaxID=3344665 RepID=UPI0035D4B843